MHTTHTIIIMLKEHGVWICIQRGVLGFKLTRFYYKRIFYFHKLLLQRRITMSKTYMVLYRPRCTDCFPGGVYRLKNLGIYVF